MFSFFLMTFSLCLSWSISTSDFTTDLLTTVLELNSGSKLYGSNADDLDWGKVPPSAAQAVSVQLIGIDGVDTYACGNNTQDIVSTTPSQPFMLYIPRGICSFAQKAYSAQQLGAVGVVIGDTVEAIYSGTLNKTGSSQDIAQDMAWNCDYGRAEVSALVEPAWDSRNSISTCSSNKNCWSEYCLPTGKNNEVCCMWDVADRMGYAKTEGSVNIPVMRIRAKDATSLASMLPMDNAKMYLRSIPKIDISSFIIWLIAVLTVMFAGWKGSRMERKQAQASRQRTTAGTAVSSSPPKEEEEELEVLVLTKWHALGFLIFGSAFLLVLFYLNVVLVVIVLFAIGSVSAVSFVIATPIYRKIYFFRKTTTESRFGFEMPLFGWVHVTELMGTLTAIGLAVLWFIERNSEYAWILQNLFGVCVSIVFLQVIRLPNIRIATILLVAVFIYDIFFVFISPYIFEESVMVKAAKGGEQTEATVGTEYCLRYPMDTEHHCLKEKVPILLRLPKLLDWQNSEVMLGLGDIVLPGLLVVFCARYDYLTRGNIFGKNTNIALPTTPQENASPVEGPMELTATPGKVPATVEESELVSKTMHYHQYACRGRFGYFFLVSFGYALGLLMANVAVVLMEQAQPALLYLVPCTLGLLVIVAKCQGNLRLLWDGFKQSKKQNETTEQPDTTAASV